MFRQKAVAHLNNFPACRKKDPSVQLIQSTCDMRKRLRFMAGVEEAGLAVSAGEVKEMKGVKEFKV